MSPLSLIVAALAAGVPAAPRAVFAALRAALLPLAQGRDPDTLAELVRAGVDVIVASGTRVTVAAKEATSQIPIVVSGAGGLTEAGVATKGTVASATTSAAKVLSSIMSAVWPLVPVPSANNVSPSMGVCTGQMLRAKPSWATCAKRWAWGFVSTASVAITPMVVLLPALGLVITWPVSWACRMSSSSRLLGAMRAPAKSWPVRGSITSPKALQTIKAATVMPLTVSAALPTPPFMAQCGPFILPIVCQISSVINGIYGCSSLINWSKI